MKIDEEKIKEVLTRNVEKMIGQEELERKLRSGRRLRIKHGVDATSSLLHLGHAVNFWKMREFQELGHKVIFLIGDFTTQIGDPTGRLEARPEISSRQAVENAKTYLAQASKILINKPSLLEVRKNSEWYKKMNILNFLKLAKKITHARLIKREMFQARISKNQEIFTHELLYPIFQGYDSVMIKSDLTIIGSDQLFNEMLGRHFQEALGQQPQTIMTTVITPGLDGGVKMSKSLGNYVAITDTPNDQFGKIMSIPDALIGTYLTVYTKLSLDEILALKKLSFLKAKERLAYEIVKLYYGEKKADQARGFFQKTLCEKKLPDDLPSYKFLSGKETLGEILRKAGLVPSAAEYRRLVRAGAGEINQRKVSDPTFKPLNQAVVRIGEKKFLKIVPS